MNLHMPNAEIFLPGPGTAEDALARTTHLCLAAHQDDIEIMAFHGIRECFGRLDRHFTGVTVTDGAGSPRDGLYGRYTDAEMKSVRREEQKKAARVGEFAAHVFLDFSSAAVKDGKSSAVIEDLAALLEACRPEVVYTHNLADKHDTHVAVALRTIAAIRRLPPPARPARMVGCEVWRGLDWMDDSHGVDTAESVTYAMDLTPLLKDDALEPAALVREHLARFQRDVEGRLAKFA